VTLGCHTARRQSARRESARGRPQTPAPHRLARDPPSRPRPNIWIEQILPAMVRGYVPEHVWLALSELSYFFRQLYAKELSRTMVV
jgi:hypothetical protein